jgi:uncharacterized protein (TIGR02118 family)
MIKRISLLTRKPHLTHEEFVKHWREIHGPLAIGVPGLRRYVQSHIQSESERSDIQTTDIQVDGIAELWYDDEASMAKASASPEAQRLFADGALIIGQIKTFVIKEEVIIDDA